MYFIWLHVWVAFKVLSSPTHTLIPTIFPLLETVLVRFFCDGFQLFRRICLNLWNRLKSSFFNGFLKFWEQEKFTRSKVRWVGLGVWKNSDRMLGHKLTSSECWVGCSVAVMEKPVITSPQFWPFASDGVSQTFQCSKSGWPYNLKEGTRGEQQP